MMLITLAAIVYAVLMGIVIIFQFCLAIGMPWGEASMGGKYLGKYPPKMRIVSVVNIFILSFISLIVLTKANILLPQYKSFSDTAIFFVIGFSAISVILNSITSSSIERKIWLPVTILQLAMSLVVAFGNYQ